MTNVGIVHPQPGYHQALRELTRKYGTLLIIDETHTICAGPGGFTRAENLDPDVLVFGKAIGGGIPGAAYGFSQEIADRADSSSTPFWQMNNQREHAQIDSRAEAVQGNLYGFCASSGCGWRGEACGDAPGTLLTRILRFSRYLSVRSRHPGSANSESTRRTTARLTTPGAIVACVPPWGGVAGSWSCRRRGAPQRARSGCGLRGILGIWGDNETFLWTSGCLRGWAIAPPTMRDL